MEKEQICQNLERDLKARFQDLKLKLAAGGPPLSNEEINDILFQNLEEILKFSRLKLWNILEQ